ncbi:hypothetical protein BYT27DRAFT_7152523 [Phlegmacium glaucopus]|nr:hypothetical protein BYT27DRAFT_7152523 [Phlegmacium glaucopus]
MPQPKAGDPWDVGYKIAREHDKEMCDGWREAVDKLLIFAGLFSATLVAFLAISCPMLNADPNAIQLQSILLLRISIQLQLASAAGANNVTTIDLPPLPSLNETFHPPSTVIITNACWFFSLILALGTVLFGTVCLQWIREFERDPRLGRKEAFKFRQMRYEGLMNWGIPFIISSLPLLLQLSLLLFFLGIGFFLQSFDPNIAAAISVLMALIVVFLCVTMMLPAMQCITSSSKSHDHRSSLCPFKTPHAHLFSIFAAWSFLLLIKIFRFLSRNPDILKEKGKFLESLLRSGSSWSSVDMAWLETSYESSRSLKDNGPYSIAALAWLAREYAPSNDARCAFYHCLRELDSPTAIKSLQKLSSGTNLGWMAVDYEVELSKDIQSAFALDDFVKVSPQLHDSLLSHRVELFVRILNQGLISRIGRRPGQTPPDVCSLFREKLLVPFKGDEDSVALDATCKIQLIRTFSSYLTAGEMHDFLADEVIKMVHKTVTTKPLPSDQMLRDELCEFNKKLYHVYRNQGGSDIRFSHKLQELVKKYVDQFGEAGYTGSRFLIFGTSFRCLARQIEADTEKGQR